MRPKPRLHSGIDGHVDDELLDYLQNNVEVTLPAHSRLLKGICDDSRKRESYYNWSRYNSNDTYIRLETLSKMAKELDITNGQLVLAWLLDHWPGSFSSLRRAPWSNTTSVTEFSTSN